MDIYSAERWALGSRLHDPAAAPADLALAVPASSSHAPPRSSWELGGEGHAPRRRPGTRSGLRADRVRAQQPAAVPGGALREPGRSLPSALCPLPSALCCSRHPAFRGPAPDSHGHSAGPPNRSPAPRLRLRAPCSVRIRASATDRCVRLQTRPPLRGGCQDPALTHFSS